MIYTIGHAENYRPAIAKNGIVHKVGRDGKKGPWWFRIWGVRSNYPGGYAFKTMKDAQRRIDEAYPTSGFAVFGLKADWETDTVPSKKGWWHHLINDSEIILL